VLVAGPLWHRSFFNECAKARGGNARHPFFGHHPSCVGMSITKFRLGLLAKGLSPKLEGWSNGAIAAQVA
jgi:hypothetical protein